ncbi:MAG: DMT family transporter [Bacteroidaceae bacterium]|jgi:drug/metabolite transporter (DMT)-like permease|nr:DMT family transporter [Bacteroidaceae bacterium]
MEGNGRTSKILVYITAFVIIVIWGCTFVQTKLLINAGLRPDEIFLFRFVLAYLLILPLAGRRLFMDCWKDEALALSLGLSGGSLYFLTENYALAYGYCSNVALIVCLTPLITAIVVGFFYPGERIGKGGMVGSLVAFVGMAMVVFNGNFILKLSPLGDVLAFGACLCWALYSLVIKRLQGKYSNMLITRKVFGYGLLTIVPWLWLRGVNCDILLTGGVVVWGNLLFLGCVASMFCFLGWNWCLERIGTVRATNFLYLNPVVAITTSALFLGERVTWLALVGAVLILCGLIYIDKNRKKQ